MEAQCAPGDSSSGFEIGGGDFIDPPSSPVDRGENQQTPDLPHAGSARISRRRTYTKRISLILSRMDSTPAVTCPDLTPGWRLRGDGRQTAADSLEL